MPDMLHSGRKKGYCYGANSECKRANKKATTVPHRTSAVPASIPAFLSPSEQSQV